MLTSEEHLINVSDKISKTIGLLRILKNISPRPALRTIYKCFIRLHLDYGDVIMIRHTTYLSIKNLESSQYNATLALTRAIRGSSREKLYQELGLESLQLWQWNRKLFIKFIINKLLLT